MSFKSSIKKALKASVSFFNLDVGGKKDVILIVAAYMHASCLIRCCPLRKYYSRYFLHDHKKPLDLKPFRKDIIRIRSVIKQLPGKHTCLKESLVVFLFFKRKGHHIPLFLGVDKKGGFQAHAWYDQNSAHGFDVLNIHE